MEHTRLHHLLSVVEMITFDLSKVWLWNTKNMEHTRLHYLLSAVEMITFRSSINLPNYSCVHDIRKKPKIEDSAKNRQFSRVGRNKDINWLQCWLTKILAKSRRDLVNCLLHCFKDNKAENEDVFFKYGAIKGRRMVLFLLSKMCGPVRHFEISVQYAFENLAWQRHFTSQRLPTQHCSGRPSSFNHLKLEA